MLRRTEPTTEPWMPTLDELVEVVQKMDRLGFDSFWCGDWHQPQSSGCCLPLVRATLIAEMTV